MANGPAAAADEVAEDYKASLEYLTNNDRYAINNFTMIAKENTEHADAISNGLIEHIGKARPDHKLPALYVLDSIAKNIGTPYTLFLGAKLYTTFMDAYSKVDRMTRKKLDEMLKTWKSPVPGSIDSRPVFPPDITVKIDNALLKVKTKTLEFEQQQQREQQNLYQRRGPGGTPLTQWRNTPTPPQQGSRYQPPIAHPYPPQQHPQVNGHYQGQTLMPQYSQIPTHGSPHPGTQYPTQPQAPHFQPYQQPPVTSADLDTLSRDIGDLIRAMQSDFAQNMQDVGLGQRLKALLDLQAILRSQTLPPDQIQAVRRQVTELQNQRQASRAALAPVPVPTPQQLGGYPSSTTPQPHLGYPPHSLPHDGSAGPPLAAVPAVNGLPSTDRLASLLASVERNRNTPVPSADVYSPKLSVVQPAVAQPAAPAAGVGEENPLIAKLRASGLLSASGTPAATPPVAHPGSAPPAPTPAQASSSVDLSALLKKVSQPGRAKEVELTSASLKIPRPHLISRLYEARPNRCLTCGKRFLADESKTKKARHMDWHFRTNKRIQDMAQKGQSRSWYVDELEWIRSRSNTDDADDAADRPGSAGAGDPAGAAGAAARANDPRNKFVRAPSGAAAADAHCPICRERFETSWRDDLQDFVWQDAVSVGGRVYHATCYEDFRRDGSATPQPPGAAAARRTSTPDSVLGKRRIEEAGEGSAAIRVKREKSSE